MALFINCGFVAWRHAWEQAAPPARPVSPGETISLPASMHGSMVMALAGMVLGVMGGEVV